MRLADGHEEGVHLVEERRIRRKVSFEKLARRLIARRGGDQPVTREHTACVRIGHEDGPAGRVEKDGIGRLRPEPGNREQRGAEWQQRLTSEPVKAPGEARVQPAREVAQPAGFQSIGAGGADRGREIGLRHRGEPARIEQPARPQLRHGARGVRPRRVLREDRAGGDLVGAPSRPPGLRAEATQKRDVQAQQARLQRIARRSRNAPPTGKEQS